MVKRSKRLKSAIESYKEEIEKHFLKLENDFKEENEILARYHIKEIDKSLIATLEYKLDLLGVKKEYSALIKKYKDKLKSYKNRFGIE